MRSRDRGETELRPKGYLVIPSVEEVWGVGRVAVSEGRGDNFVGLRLVKRVKVAVVGRNYVVGEVILGRGGRTFRTCSKKYLVGLTRKICRNTFILIKCIGY